MRICQHCGATERRDDPVLECWVNGERSFLHRGCQANWLKATDGLALPANSKILGKVPGHRCELCGSGGDVCLIQLPGEHEAAERHSDCAGRYWRKMREIPTDSWARHLWMNDYDRHIGSTDWKRFRCEVIKQRGNRCERCGQVSAYLELHHKHYYSLGSEQPEDVELLCPKCHRGADEDRAAKSRA